MLKQMEQLKYLKLLEMPNLRTSCSSQHSVLCCMTGVGRPHAANAEDVEIVEDAEVAVVAKDG
ncbi:hypothetical protein [Paenibacillus sp. HB172176]|uniref:hypothetical protein n=1 Tax=Paenibacillus sp. HB172176 TaxID=2493690 RepID=UPI00143A4678|nr:hypothetical protein [Paenibacillus sp. HB172176]